MADEYQDWQPVVLKKTTGSKKPTKQDIATAERSGAQVTAVKKFNAGTNKNVKIDKNLKKLDEETEEFSHAKVGLHVGQLIQQGRQAKNMTQKELAQRICQKPSIVAEYEQGKAIPNNKILLSMEKVLGVKLRGAKK
eukprot:TRINITY_DN7000_c0_g1_i1.p1 TRINITY_DN7000_c0_g1~~TRINITY_DN7000_c0_g1_i1.p1  ORF type:complete len:137 (+),score=35.62 TRINITY_DN7000_c0_g1_i1:33-443(+)